MLSADFKGRKCEGCGYCIHADHEKMKCFPESDDCQSEYAVAWMPLPERYIE